MKRKRLTAQRRAAERMFARNAKAAAREAVAAIRARLKEARAEHRAIARTIRTLEQQAKRAAAAAKRAKVPKLKTYFAVVERGAVRAVRTTVAAAKKAAKRGGVVTPVHATRKPSKGQSVPSSSAQAFDLRAFAARVRATAARPDVDTFHGDRAFICSVFDRGFKGRMARAEFDRQLIAAHRAGLVRLARADLVGAMSPELVRRSEIRYLSASFHFVAVE